VAVHYHHSIASLRLKYRKPEPKDDKEEIALRKAAKLADLT
jgi:hypothetical protein